MPLTLKPSYFVYEVAPYSFGHRTSGQAFLFANRHDALIYLDHTNAKIGDGPVSYEVTRVRVHTMEEGGDDGDQ